MVKQEGSSLEVSWFKCKLLYYQLKYQRVLCLLSIPYSGNEKVSTNAIIQLLQDVSFWAIFRVKVISWALRIHQEKTEFFSYAVFFSFVYVQYSAEFKFREEISIRQRFQFG